MSQRVFLDAEGFLQFRSDIGAQLGADVRNTGCDIHDIYISSFIADLLDGFSDLLGDGLQLFSLCLLQGLLVVPVGLLETLVEILQLGLTALAYVVEEVGLFFLELLALLLEFILHTFEVIFVLLGEILQLGLSSVVFRHELNDFCGVEVTEFLY